MKAKDIIIYTDMDGTALSDWDKGPVVPERSLQLIQRFVAEGGCFSVASGREASGILRYFPEVEFKAPLVCYNGAVVCDADSGEVLRKFSLPESSLQDCWDCLLAHPEAQLLASTEHRLYQVLTGDPQRDHVPEDWEWFTLPMENFLAGEFVKVAYLLPDGGDMEGFKADFSRMPHHDLVVGAQSAPLCYEVVEHSVNKGMGIRYALEAAGLENRTLVCIGDYYNDWAMLQTADIAACPETSPREIRDICKIITCGNNEGAVGDLIERLNLW